MFCANICLENEVEEAIQITCDPLIYQKHPICKGFVGISRTATFEQCRNLSMADISLLLVLQ